MLLFRPQDKLAPVSFQVNLNRKRKEQSFLSFWRKHKSLQVSRQVNLNHRLTNGKPKPNSLKLVNLCKDKQYLLHKTFP